LPIELLVIEGLDRGQRFLFTPPARVTIGRGEGCEISLADPRVSRRHFCIEVERDACTIRDLASANGTWVNGALAEAGALADGDRIRVGDTTIECAIGPDDEAAPALPGYRFLERIGAGATGRVHKAVQIALGRLVAVKVIPIERGADPREVARIVRGARAEALLSHPHVVQVHDFIRARDLHIVMEYVEGTDLRRLTLERGRLAAREAAAIGVQVLSALQHAFERGIVHRDVKPDNVLVTTSGHAKLADFGLAKPLEEAGRSGITRPDEAPGTPAYMAPEQLLAAASVDHRADIYSLGATLYHALAGAPPFTGSVGEVVRRIQREEPPPGVPAGLAAAIRRALAKEPSARFASAAEFAAAIQA
jgi:serine/threonine protein kinase